MSLVAPVAILAASFCILSNSFFSYWCAPGASKKICVRNTDKLTIVKCLFLLSIFGIISIFHGCMVWIEISVTRVTAQHHEACRVMPNSDPE